MLTFCSPRQVVFNFTLGTGKGIALDHVNTPAKMTRGGNWQYTAGSAQLAVHSWECTAGSAQLAVHSWQCTAGSAVQCS
jgi:hypothetical protein